MRRGEKGRGIGGVPPSQLPQGPLSQATSRPLGATLFLGAGNHIRDDKERGRRNPEKVPGNRAPRAKTWGSGPVERPLIKIGKAAAFGGKNRFFRENSFPKKYRTLVK